MGDAKVVEVKEVSMSEFWAPIYDKAFVEGKQVWCVISDVMTDPKIIKTGLTEEQADAWIKLLRS